MTEPRNSFLKGMSHVCQVTPKRDSHTLNVRALRALHVLWRFGRRSQDTSRATISFDPLGRQLHDVRLIFHHSGKECGSSAESRRSDGALGSDAVRSFQLATWRSANLHRDCVETWTARTKEKSTQSCKKTSNVATRPRDQNSLTARCIVLVAHKDGR